MVIKTKKVAGLSPKANKLDLTTVFHQAAKECEEILEFRNA
jgi:hypothetical protein